MKVNALRPEASTAASSAQQAALDPVFAVRFTHKWAFPLAWFLVISAHVGVVVAYNHESYIIQYILVGSRSEMAVQLLGLGAKISPDIGITLLHTNSLLMAWHVFAASQAVLCSFWYRTFTFRVRWYALPPLTLKRIKTWRKRTTTVTSIAEEDNRKKDQYRRVKLLCCNLVGRVPTVFKSFYMAVGVRGQYFDLAFAIRETFEIAMQTVQAYSISSMVSNTDMLHFVAMVLILNCWSTPMLHFFLRGANREGLKRLCSLVCDAFFDFCCALAIPFLSFSLWEHQVATYDMYDAVWRIRSSTLLNFNLVNTWVAVFTTRLPAVGLIITMETIKSMLARDRRGHAAHNLHVIQLSSDAKTHEPQRVMKAHPSTFGSRMSAFVSKWAHRMFAAYGVLILGLYIESVTKTPGETQAANCQLPVYPWGRVRYGCAVVELDCTRLATAGDEDVLDAALVQFNTPDIASLIVSHCPSLEMPPRLQELQSLLHLEIYNSSFARWGKTAEIHGDHHPRLTSVTLVRVANMTRLPAGLQPSEFPASLRALTISNTDLVELPEDQMATTWPRMLFVVVIERSALLAFPPALLSKGVTQTISFAGNKITSVPVDLFLHGGIPPSLWLSKNPIESLPVSITTSNEPPLISPIRELQVSGTNLLTLPSWLLDGSVCPFLTTVWADSTPLCSGTQDRPLLANCSSTNHYVFPLEHYESLRLVPSLQTR